MNGLKSRDSSIAPEATVGLHGGAAPGPAAEGDAPQTPALAQLPPFLVGVATFIVAGVGYWLAARIGLAFVPKGGQITPVWPPNGLLVGLLLITPFRRWPLLLLGAAVACVLANLSAGRSLLVGGLFTLVNALEIFVIAAFLRNYRREAYDFATRGQVVMFAVGSVLIGGLIAIPGAMIGWIHLEGDLFLEWQKWWTGDVVGMLLAAPLVTCAYQLYRRRSAIDVDQVMEAIGLMLVHMLLCFAVFFVGPVLQRESLLDATVYPYLTLLTLLLAAARLGAGGSAVASMISAGLALWAQYPPISGILIAPNESAVMSVQIFLTLSAATGLFIGAQRSERLVANEALRTSETRFRTLATRAPVGIFLSGPDGGTTFVNEACSALTGIPGENLLGNAAASAFHPADRKRVLEAWNRMITTGQEFREEYRFRHVDGKPRWVIGRATPIRQTDATVDGYVGTLTDITAQKDAEARLMESESRFRQLADASPAMIWTSDAEGRYDYLNRAWLEFRGRRLEQELGWGSEEGIHPEDIAQVWEVLRDAAETRTAYSMEYRFQRADGEYRHVLSHGAPRYGVGRSFLGFVGTAIDITPLKQAEQERLQMHERVQEAARLDSIVVLAGGVAHEFNNMLTAILGNASLAELDPGVNGETREYLACIQDTSMRAADLTRKLLAYSGRTAPTRHPVSLSRILTETEPLLRTSLTPLIYLEIHLDSVDVPVRVDRAQVQQVIINLFTNAVEALEKKGGVVRIETGHCMCSEAMLLELGQGAELPVGEYAFLQVADNGIGIPDDIRERIFEPFFSTHFAGRGLGLAAVQGIVRGHGGALQVKSEVGAGSALTIYFPAVSITPGPTTGES